MWVEWDQGLLNLDFVSRIYLDESMENTWSLRVVMANQKGEYAKYFKTEKEAKEELRKLSWVCIPMSTMGSFPLL
jgi:hypothetical protein